MFWSYVYEEIYNIYKSAKAYCELWSYNRENITERIVNLKEIQGQKKDKKKVLKSNSYTFRKGNVVELLNGYHSHI